ncbi:BlaI/MecI/CopY family transcriptional regulator [Streptomyces lasalocidi]|uniref:Uncharacterized protein n=1 Tax=Streptomyces lasalocidi TaxID=324833 RepID=A0A4U5W4E7_STRLS|nr:BlaI/MecI/CopY family transcriptional regulator [Streptomyces lasalocidi]TKS96277.1 hypothetical protein E4U91_36920 [Streptomyces lasalocidi]
MANEPEVPTVQSLQSQYEARFANHLSENREEQARLRARLEELVADEAWLARALEAMSAQPEDSTEVQEKGQELARSHRNATEAVEAAGAAESAIEASSALVRQRQGKSATAPVKKSTAKKSTAKKTTAKKASAAKKSAPDEQVPAANKTRAQSSEPSLGLLLLSILRRHTGQPRTAGEVVSDLEQEHPERAREVNTVRNTLERLVAKSLVDRMKQKNTVLYTVAADAVSASDDAGNEASEPTG